MKKDQVDARMIASKPSPKNPIENNVFEFHGNVDDQPNQVSRSDVYLPYVFAVLAPFVPFLVNSLNHRANNPRTAKSSHIMFFGLYTLIFPIVALAILYWFVLRKRVSAIGIIVFVTSAILTTCFNFLLYHVLKGFLYLK